MAVALLGITQRQFRAHFDPKTCRSQTRNRIPVEPKTVGEWLHLKRIEADLSQAELAKRLGIGDRKVQAWERGQVAPTKPEWQSLAGILRLGSGIPCPNPAAE